MLLAPGTPSNEIAKKDFHRLSPRTRIWPVPRMPSIQEVGGQSRVESQVQVADVFAKADVDQFVEPGAPLSASTWR